MVKRIGYLWDRMISFGNLLAAAHESARRKRFEPAVASFHFGLERELWKLHRELTDGTWEPGPYQAFYVYEPRKRMISAAPYRDRVVHHALVRILTPIFDPSFITDSFACRVGKGTHAAVRRAQYYSRQFRYVLKADIRKFFPSMDHQILNEWVSRRIKDPNVLNLVSKLVAHSNPQEATFANFPGDDLFTSTERRHGIPIGNQTSQFFANVYLDPLDHFIKDRLRIKGYVRYVDDFLVFSNDKRQLHQIRCSICEFLEKLRLKLHPQKSVILPVDQGIRFLGYRVFPTHRLLVKDNVRRFRRRVRKMEEEYACGTMTLEEVRQRLMSWSGHAAQADTCVLRSRLFANMRFQRAKAE